MPKPLEGKTVVVTRAVDQADELVIRLKELGVEVIHIPTIEIMPPDSWQACDAAIEKLHQYQWLIFTSTNGVRFFIERLKTLESLQSKQIAAVGERTKAVLKELGLRVALVPEEFRAEGLVQAFEKKNIQGLRILYPKAQVGRDLLIKRLESMGAIIDGVAVYKTQAPSKDQLSKFQLALNAPRVDVLTFTSPSTVRNFISAVGEKKIKDWLTKGCRIAVIGEVTAEASERYNLRVDILPKKSTVPSLVEAILEYFSCSKN